MINKEVNYKNLQKPENLKIEMYEIIFKEILEIISIQKETSNLQKPKEIKESKTGEILKKPEIKNVYYCSFCNKTKESIPLECYHNICKECYILELEKYTDNCLIPICDIKCMKCQNVSIKYDQVSKICPLSILEEKKKENSKKALLFKCQACSVSHSRENLQFVELFCGHTFCLQSFKIPTITKISNLKSEDKFIKCPFCKISNSSENDPSIINKFIFLKYIFDANLFRSLQNAFLNLYDNEEDKKVSYSCIYCSKYFAIIPKNLTSIECPLCKIKCCPFCGNKNTQEGTICEQCQKINKEKKDFEEAVKKIGLNICPYCKTITKMKAGCKAVYCPSCKKMFCKFCERKLIEAYHFSHFYGKPFGDKCKGQDNLPDK